jgi:hypothetical protein
VAEEAAVFAIELCGAFVADLKSRAVRIETLLSADEGKLGVSLLSTLRARPSVSRSLVSGTAILIGRFALGRGSSRNSKRDSEPKGRLKALLNRKATSERRR